MASGIRTRTSSLIVDIAVAPPLPTFTSWSNISKHAGSTLSNNNLTATDPGQGHGITVAGKTTGKYYWETVVSASVLGPDAQGIADVNDSDFSSVLGSVNQSEGWSANGQVKQNAIPLITI